ncbi:GerAB/ArcD/ProY family transporter [Paenibacillus agricola]|uniref:GerAB/ArcD/ProY family transporter n=1 Tax=Paenibacillus agricola TaxID=2716264 RepID=UPI0028934E0D|nr:GerAB/ArcD/ProY family transporter [Paenibacillus agricola]
MDRSLPVVTMYIITNLGLLFFLYPGDIISSTDESHWIPISLGLATHFLFLSMYMKGLSYFRNRDIISIYVSTGKTVAVIFLLPMMVYLLIIAIIILRACSEIITIVFLSSTPLWSIIILLLSMSTYMAAQSMQSVFRTGVLLAILFLPSILFVLLLSFQNIDWHYIYPLWNNDFSFLKQTSYLKSYFAFSGSFLFLGFVQPGFTYQRYKVQLAAIVLMPFFLLSVYIPVLTFGQATASTLTFPFVVALDAAQVNWLIFDRITMFFLLNLITFIILFLASLLWMTSKIAAICLPAVKPAYMVVSIAAVLYIFCLMIPDWKEVDHFFVWNTPLRFYMLIAIPISIYYLGLRFKRKERHADK